MSKDNNEELARKMAKENRKKYMAIAFIIACMLILVAVLSPKEDSLKPASINHEISQKAKDSMTGMDLEEVLAKSTISLLEESNRYFSKGKILPDNLEELKEESLLALALLNSYAINSQKLKEYALSGGEKIAGNKEKLKEVLGDSFVMYSSGEILLGQNLLNYMTFAEMHIEGVKDLDEKMRMSLPEELTEELKLKGFNPSREGLFNFYLNNLLGIFEKEGKVKVGKNSIYIEEIK